MPSRAEARQRGAVGGAFRSFRACGGTPDALRGRVNGEEDEAMDEQTERSGLDRYLSSVDVWAMAFGCMVGWGAFVLPAAVLVVPAGLCVLLAYHPAQPADGIWRHVHLRHRAVCPADVFRPDVAGQASGGQEQHGRSAHPPREKRSMP